jgi:predicted protein tyrosine phosphatase
VIDYLFVCSANLQRSPTAEHVARLMGYKASSVGSVPFYSPVRLLNRDAIECAEHIVCMQEEHASAVRAMINYYRMQVCGDIEVWDIPDDFSYCEPALIKLIEAKLPKRVLSDG